MNRQFFIGGAVTLVLVVVGLTAYGATISDQKEEIERQNDCAMDPDSCDTEKNGDTSVFKLEVGDCVKQSALDESESEAVPVVQCLSDDAFGIVTELFVVSKSGSYPSVSYFNEQADLNCLDGPDSGALYPTARSWELGDRTVVCIAEL